MAARWIGVYRTVDAPGPALTRSTIVPPERNFPLPVVVIHGVLAVTTVVLVLVTALGVR
jgi:manganese efflux pump family protein